MATVAQPLLTAEEFGHLPDNGRRAELIRGRVVELALRYPRHGEVCSNINCLMGNFLEVHRMGRLVINSGVITERDPDTVRGTDIAYYSIARVPGRMPWDRYLDAAPELIIEVRSPGDRWSEIQIKVGEYRQAGVNVVCVADDPTERVHVFDDDGNRILAGDDELTFPTILPGFRVAVRRFFE